DDLVRVCSASLNAATLNVAQQDELRGGIASVGVAVSSSNTAVGTLVNSPDGIPGGQGCTYQTAPEMMFHPVGAGTATLTVVAPSGFSTPSNNQSITATVNAPALHRNKRRKRSKVLHRKSTRLHHRHVTTSYAVVCTKTR